jgi:hypothetical protein
VAARLSAATPLPVQKENLMRTLTLVAACLAAATLAFAPAAHADDEVVFQKLIKDKAATVVAVKIVLAVKFSGMGQSGEREVPRESTGIVVDAAGVVMLPATDLDASLSLPAQMRAQITITSAPTSIRVVFPGDTREYNAVLGAKDSKLGLAFVIIKDLADMKPMGLDMGATAEPKLGQTLYGVERLDQGFDYAPIVNRAKVAGSVTKPRSMWVLSGASGSVGKPLYDVAGAVTGIVVNQEGVGTNATSRPFLLPLTVAQPVIGTAIKKSKAELERILEEEEEAAAEAAGADKDAPKKDAPKKDAPKKDAPKKDEPKDDGKKDGE